MEKFECDVTSKISAVFEATTYVANPLPYKPATACQIDSKKVPNSKLQP